MAKEPERDRIETGEFTRASATHDELWQCVGTAGTLTLRAQLDLWNMLQPATQPTSTLDYTPEPETVTVTFKSDAALAVTLPGATVQRVSDHESRVTVARPQEDRWQSLTLTLATPARALDVSYATTRDPRPRALGTRRWLVPFARPGVHDREDRVLPELAGGNWEKGHELFRGKAACLTCHTLRGEGFNVGPDLNNLVHRDYASVLRDIVEPSAVINPDAVGYTVTLKNGEVLTGTRAGESEETFNLAQPGSQ
ncbi:MAG: heme-binding protein, partial [Verrucomicrobia bacterium]|nr:heme-binding protein [Verrucomicrobiota bacterium]